MKSLHTYFPTGSLIWAAIKHSSARDFRVELVCKLETPPVGEPESSHTLGPIFEAEDFVSYAAANRWYASKYPRRTDLNRHLSAGCAL